MLIVTCRQLSTDGRRRELRQRRHPLLHPVEPGDGAHVQRVLSRVSERDHHLRPVPSDRRHVLLVAKAVHQELRSRQYSSFLLSFYSSMWRCDPLEPVYNSLHQFTIFQPISNGSTCFNRVVVIVLTFSPPIRFETQAEPVRHFNRFNGPFAEHAHNDNHCSISSRLLNVTCFFFFCQMFQVTVDRRQHYLSSVCMACLEGWTCSLRCRSCHTRWDGSSLILGTMYSYDVFAAVPCCPDRLRVTNSAL